MAIGFIFRQVAEPPVLGVKSVHLNYASLQGRSPKQAKLFPRPRRPANLAPALYTPFGSGFHSTPASRFSAAINAICNRVAIDALPIWGSTTQLGSENSGLSG